MKTIRFTFISLSIGLFVLLNLSVTAFAQGTAFTHQGRLSDNGAPANGQYDLQFALFDALTGGAQQGLALTLENVQVTNGVFSVQLDFGAEVFTGAARWLEIRVRPGTGTGADPFTTLAPRQPITPTPYALHSRNTLNLGGVAASNYLQTNGNGSALTSLNAANITSGVVPIANGGTGSATQNFVDLTTAQTIAGNKTFSATLSGNTVNATTQYNIGGNRVLSVAGSSNLFVGEGVSQSGSANAIFGAGAGAVNTGSSNAFFGALSGNSNTTGARNTLIGLNTDVGSGDLQFATAIGAGAVVSTSDTIQLGRANGRDRVNAPGGITTSGGLTVTGGTTVTGSITTSGDINLDGHDLILSPIIGDTNHAIRYNSVINGLEFRAFDGFIWRHVRGNDVNMTLEPDGDLLIAGDYKKFSDARYKTNVQTFGNALDAVRRLRGVTFHWKPEHNTNSRQQIGFIAQEVEAVLPELVSTNQDGYKSVAYSNVVPVLVEAVKEQQTQLTAQQQELKRVQAENAALAAQLQAVLARLAALEKKRSPPSPATLNKSTGALASRRFVSR